LRLAEADAALSGGHIGSADAAVARLPHDMPEGLLYESELMRARLFAQERRMRDAALLFSAVEKSGDAFASARAVYYRVEAAIAAGVMRRDAGIEALEELRYRWRGDYVELLTLRKLGALYFAKQDWRNGLRTLRVATLNFPNDDLGRQVQDDMRGA